METNKMYGVALNGLEEPILVAGSKFLPTHKMKIVRKLLPEIAKKYCSMINLAPVGSNVFVFKETN